MSADDPRFDSMPQDDLADLAGPVADILTRLDEDRVIPGIWAKNPAVWGKGPKEVVDRLGWLTAPRSMVHKLPALADLAAGARRDGIRHVVLLGMGGSSLGAEVLRASLPAAEGAPELLVLDSTVPAWVEDVSRRIDPARTVFVVASKSGTTAEVTSLHAFFAAQVEAAGVEEPGSRFVAVTDPQTVLGDAAKGRGFRALFENDPEIGGRFSVLSYFGLVPAALAGLDVGRLLASAAAMAQACGADVPAAENPGALLGAVLGAGVRAGRNQLTLLTSPGLASFGLWAEQLIAESTGKEGTGVLPIAEEPLAAVESYGAARLFVALRLAGDDNGELDEQRTALAEAGFPVLTLDLKDTHDLGAELFRWEMATAVAGHLLGIQPFDQPDVDSTKRHTREMLEAFESHGELPQLEAPSDLAAALRGERPAYVALMAYLGQSEAIDRAIEALRRRLLEEHSLATTFGYAPRMLHSTGQLHKGGFDGGLFVQLLPAEAGDGPAIPGLSYGFGTLARAQALGDAKALLDRPRRCLRIPLDGDPAAAIEALTRTL